MSTNVEGTFDRVKAICKSLTDPNKPGGRKDTTVSEAIEATTCYLIACERCRTTHHLEDKPSDVVFTPPLSIGAMIAMQKAWEAVWDVIGDCNTSNPRYVAAWEVWGCLTASRMADGPDGFAALEPFLQ
jgi:hypothetical protein